MKRGITFIFVCLILLGLSKNIYSGTMKIGRDTREPQLKKMDINTVTEGEMLNQGIAGTYVEKISKFRTIVGGFTDIEELKRIEGIGDKTYKKLEKNFCIENILQINRISINIADDKTLKYYGFSKNEIKKLRKNQDKGIYIGNNMELKEFIRSEKRYIELRDIVDYDTK